MVVEKDPEMYTVPPPKPVKGTVNEEPKVRQRSKFDQYYAPSDNHQHTMRGQVEPRRGKQSYDHMFTDMPGSHDYGHEAYKTQLKPSFDAAQYFKE